MQCYDRTNIAIFSAVAERWTPQYPLHQLLLMWAVDPVVTVTGFHGALKQLQHSNSSLVFMRGLANIFLSMG